jgi:dihydroorotate dehydrogenase
VYSGFIYRGWEVARLISAELAALVEQRGVPSLAELARERPTGAVAGGA